MELFKVLVHAELNEPLPNIDEPYEPPVSRFYRSYVVRAENGDRARDTVFKDVGAGGAKVLSFEAPVPAARRDLPMLAWLGLFDRKPGIVWRSGRAFYEKED